MAEQYPPPDCTPGEPPCDLPAVHAQLRELTARMVQMDQRDQFIEGNISEIARRQHVMHSQMLGQGRQLSQVLDGISALADSPSNFARLAKDVGGSVRLTKRLWKLVVLAATGLAAIFGVLHYGQSKGEAVDPPAAQQDAPRGEE